MAKTIEKESGYQLVGWRVGDMKLQLLRNLLIARPNVNRDEPAYRSNGTRQRSTPRCTHLRVKVVETVSDWTAGTYICQESKAESSALQISLIPRIVFCGCFCFCCSLKRLFHEGFLQKTKNIKMYKK